MNRSETELDEVKMISSMILKLPLTPTEVSSLRSLSRFASVASAVQLNLDVAIIYKIQSFSLLVKYQIAELIG